jgi:hypothetical protein
MPNGPYHYNQAIRLTDQAHHYTYGDGADPVTGNALANEATARAINGLTAIMVTIAEILDHMAGGGRHFELDAWRTAIPVARVEKDTPAGGGSTPDIDEEC